MLDDLYNKKILQLASGLNKNINISNPDGNAMLRSPVCGSSITIDIKMNDDVICAYGHKVRACTLGQAAAAIMMANAIGKSKLQLLKLQSQVHSMLNGGDDLPDGCWSGLNILQSASKFKTRHGSIMLPFNTIIIAIEMAENI